MGMLVIWNVESEGNGRRCLGNPVTPLATFCTSNSQRNGSNEKSKGEYHRRPKISPRPRNRPASRLRALNKLSNGVVVVPITDEFLNDHGDAAQFSKHGGVPQDLVTELKALVNHPGDEVDFASRRDHFDLGACACLCLSIGCTSSTVGRTN